MSVSRSTSSFLVAAFSTLTLAVSAPALAHHSFAPYDPERQITFTGVVTSFKWNNPHVYIEMDALDEAGQTKHWLIECANPGILNRVGWKWNMIGEGDRISVIVSPLRNGEPAALLKAIRLPDAEAQRRGLLGEAAPAEAAG